MIDNIHVFTNVKSPVAQPTLPVSMIRSFTQVVCVFCILMPTSGGYDFCVFLFESLLTYLMINKSINGYTGFYLQTW